MWVILPLAGEGSRLQSVTEGAAKCLVQVNGRSLLSRLLDQLPLETGGLSLVLSPSHRDQILQEVSAHPRGFAVEVTIQPKAVGLANAIRLGAEGIARAEPTGPQSVLVLWGDNVFGRGLPDLVPAAGDPWGGILVESARGDSEGGAEEQDVTSPGPLESTPLGWVEPGPDGFAASVWKGLRNSPNDRRVAGGFLLPAEILNAVRETKEPLGFEELIERSMKKGVRMRLLSVQGPRWNVNTPEDLEQAEAWTQRHEPTLDGARRGEP